eukprot:3073251-Pyramimonas_sp.AAC.2
MRHYQYLSGEALHWSALLLQVAEISTMLPRQLRTVTVALIPKKVPSFRPIGAFSSPFRLRGELRRPWALEREAENDRPCETAGKRRSANDTVQRQSARAESSTSAGTHAASYLLGLNQDLRADFSQSLWGTMSSA